MAYGEKMLMELEYLNAEGKVASEDVMKEVEVVLGNRFKELNKPSFLVEEGPRKQPWNTS